MPSLPETPSETPPALCPNCHVGNLREKRTTYTEPHNGQLIVVPNVPSHVCDYCGEIFFHPVVLERLHQLLLADPGTRTTGGHGKRSPLNRPTRGTASTVEPNQ